MLVTWEQMGLPGNSWELRKGRGPGKSNKTVWVQVRLGGDSPRRAELAPAGGTREELPLQRERPELPPFLLSNSFGFPFSVRNRELRKSFHS